ncbi:alpha-1,3-mannosyl-glycoprotein 4-beta-N-acetylglucosaminyltransferase C-like isoform X1 [Equus przewalskii]|uniref:Alpha-1,3-mannosyl-glycoprotein 4-beta-N-acetylglucosaminyltransferase C-like isoform X1 n=2 Tax=Equus przewalskii TaxID=9798 RepID=A0ABM4N098_EQUPR|nr:PREDICTED: alpha-1,3-mannosyl-glycoprotein 4-beta-N-acetylglucosaminyltransferase C-like [Equus przewalskii]XP_008524716.1 PREDICTED: alpha-1,3-mannosyl-glycoprotein 4-beta-N-acetylglucosaminyltransferase C-like [Equus przewalskii]XP_008524717.1 PREDICTED: alpha-1,3-mannosyl-glycoprotein 4-beta-N-acetylglucosaminyltransferase C-like [Equus przewalskii]
MSNLLWRLILIATAGVFPIFFFIKENPFDTASFLSLEEKEVVAWQRARMQINPGRTKHLETFELMQKNSEPLKKVNSRIVIGFPPVEKKLLTIGIASVQHPQGSYLLATLQSLFFASSSSERKHFIVLVHLADPDPKWLSQMISNISTLFKPYIQARQLVVINTPLKSYLSLKDLKKNFNDIPAYVAFPSKQNMDYAFLMNFATNHSDYFLMIEDDVKCAPGFVTQIATTVSAWENKHWVTLEFSQLGFIGKLFHARDLPRFVHFLLLFHQEMPGDCLLSHFHDLLMQEPRIHFFPSLFQHIDNYSSFEGKFNSLEDKEFKENDIGSPSNPAASIYTNLNVPHDSVLINAYSLDRNFFYAKSAEAGSHLTVVLDIPAEVFRVQVLTGSDLKGKNWLKEGHVELGFDCTNRINDCDDYILLGLLVNGSLNKQVLSNESGKKVKCVRLLVTATSPSGIVVRHINLWTK